jgi:hypothetical protein
MPMARMTIIALTRPQKAADRSRAGRDDPEQSRRFPEATKEAGADETAKGRGARLQGRGEAAKA